MRDIARKEFRLQVFLSFRSYGGGALNAQFLFSTCSYVDGAVEVAVFFQCAAMAKYVPSYGDAVEKGSSGFFEDWVLVILPLHGGDRYGVGELNKAN